MKTYRIYYMNGNQKLFKAFDMAELIQCLHEDVLNKYRVREITKIEEVK